MHAELQKEALQEELRTCADAAVYVAPSECSMPTGMKPGSQNVVRYIKYSPAVNMATPNQFQAFWGAFMGGRSGLFTI